MLHNNLDPEVAEHPDELVVYGGTGTRREGLAVAARDRGDRCARCTTTRRCSSSRGDPVGVVQTHEWAPRVLLANSNLVPEWATWDEFRRLEHLGLTMYGQMTAGSWIYIGTQGILQGTYETFAAIAEKRFGGSLAGTLTVTCGAGGMGGAQPLAVTMNGGTVLVADVDPSRIERRLHTNYLDTVALGLDEALAPARRGAHRGAARCRSASSPTAPSCSPSSSARRARRHRHRPDPGARPAQLRARGPRRRRRRGARAATPSEYLRRSRASMVAHCEALVALQDAGRRGLRLRQLAARRGGRRRLRAGVRVPGLRPRLHPAPRSARARGRSDGSRCPGDPADIAVTDRAVLELFPDNERLARWITMAGERVRVPGAARADLLARLRRARRRRAALQRARGVRARSQAPIVIGRDHLDCGSVASPYRETEGDARRLRRDRRLAAAQRAREHRERRVVGVDPPRRRRGDRPVDPRRPGLRRRRDRARGARSSSACCATTRRWACFATSTRATTRRARSPRRAACDVPMRERGEPASGRGAARCGGRDRRRRRPTSRGTAPASRS